MTTVTMNTSESAFVALDSVITVTPATPGGVEFRCTTPPGADAVPARRMSSPADISVPAGSTIHVYAFGGDAEFSVASANQTLADGAVVALSEISPVQTLTATGTAQTGAGYFRGIVVRAIDGAPQTVTVYDATSATGTAIAVFTASAVGTFYWDGDWTTPGNGKGGRRPLTTGCHVVISGGTSRTVDVMVEAA
jgi:hypothetical protein